MRWLPPAQGGRLLDMGCGNGGFLARMRELGWDVAGVEPDPAAAALARQRLGDVVFASDLEGAGLPSASFDAVTLSHVIEHVPEPVRTLRECGRLLRRDGRLVIVTPNTECLGRRWFGAFWQGWSPPQHLFLFTPRSLRLAAQRAGLRVFEVTTPASEALMTLARRPDPEAGGGSTT